MDIQDFFDKLKHRQIDDIHEAKEHFFLNHWVYARSRSKMAVELPANNIPYTNPNHDPLKIQFRLSNIKVTCEEYYGIYDVVVYNSQGKADLDLSLHLHYPLALSSLLDYNAKLPKLFEEWNSIEQQVYDVCEQNFKKNWERFAMELTARSPNDSRWILKQVFEKILEHKIQTWPKEFRQHDNILSEFRRQGCSFRKEENGTDYFCKLGEVKISYTKRMFSALIEYKGIDCYTDKVLNGERIRTLAEIIPALYNQTCIITDEAIKRTKLCGINKKTMESLLESKMQELSLEYALFKWDGKRSSNGEWYNEQNTVGIELKIKCKNRRCLTFHVRYEKMEQFLKIMDELPRTIETINALPFNALVSIYGNDIHWKKVEQ